MTSTTFTNSVTLSDDDWFNDLNRLHYTILSDPADAAAVKTALFPAWTTPTFSAGDFTASASMTWTVEAGDVVAYAYIINGKMMTITFSLTNTTVGGTPDTILKIAIPASKVATKDTYAALGQLLDNSARTTGSAYVAASGTVIQLQRTDNGNWSASTNATSIRGQITFEIN